MDKDRLRFADDLYRASREHDEACPNRLERFRNLEPQTTELIALLIRASSARCVLELGTSNGYSTIWLADAVQDTGGELTSVEIDPARTELARENLRRLELADRVELRTEDAQLTLTRSDAARWDFVFLDAERAAYPSYVPDLVRVLAPGGVLAVDNVISHQHELHTFTDLIEARGDLTQAVVPVGAGLRLAVRARAGVESSL